MAEPSHKGAFNPNLKRAQPLKDWDIPALVSALKSGDIVTLSRCITILESDLEKDIRSAEQILLEIPVTQDSVRIGVSGPPGAGKSTLIEELGLMLCELGHKVAVLAIDPTSLITGGSILGDKTRMEKLSRHPNSFIRPSPTKGVLGGVGAFSREACLLCEVAGFNYIFIETVGVGQSEYSVRDMVDLMLMVLSPGSGDDLQSIKKGILEVCDLLIVNKWDGPQEVLAQRTYLDFRTSLGEQRAKQLIKVSALKKKGLDELWDRSLSLIESWKSNQEWNRRRKDQDINWFHRTFQYRAMKLLSQNPVIESQIKHEENLIRTGQKSSIQAAFSIVEFIQSLLQSKR